ncbi:PHD finger protein MALE STERILITY 1 isoform X2 [Vitis riparia]|uniref:PHD finger protein MALE STERILITY 1 isoform X2 n=1 Tax=Vitis riparia TaxID=96939 RepID=UPI00155ADF2D|nr:PHD finger protein MALE STERILITY 1 isoform X2 [Vitis riparia]
MSCGMLCWSFQLELHRHPPAHILLFVVEEPIEASTHRHCNHCKYVGWGHHMICNRKYHFVVPSRETEAVFGHDSNYEGPDSRKGERSIVGVEGHAMHGVIHSNGFGHLLCVNGLEMGSDLAGRHIMDFWDRLCTSLRARKVSIYDISQKKGMDLRLLHGVAYSKPWFGRWGYGFGRGSFGVTQPMYQKAIDAIQGMPLCLLIHHLGSSNHDIPLIFSRWSPKRVEMAARVIVEALRRAEFRWVSRQEVRDAARAYIGDTGLLDFVLKSLGNHIVGNYLVRRSLNPVTKVLEYCLEDISTVFPSDEGLVMNDSKLKARYKITRIQLMKDMFYLYKNILKEQKQTVATGIFSTIPVAARVILDTKYLIKEYCGGQPSEVKVGLKLYCTVVSRNNDEDDDGTEKALPFECIIFKDNSTVHELKLEVERNFREIYWGLRSFCVESIVNLNAKGSDLVFGLVEAGSELLFEGNDSKVGINNEGIYESGHNNCTVDCPCGAKDDDGERMISCDICEVWQHTRCAQIPNNEEIPHIFLCNQCEQEIILFPSLP